MIYADRIRKDVDVMLGYIRAMLSAKLSSKGQGIVEYALILAFVVAIAVVALSGDSGIGQAIKDLFSNTGNEITNAGSNVSGNAGT